MTISRRHPLGLLKHIPRLLILNPAVGLDAGANSFAYLPAVRQAIKRIILFIL
jgi:hypothetical protein